MIGTRVAGRYDIEEQIGIGGMGIVYRAYDSRLKRHVALKVIAPHLVQQEAARAQFLREAQALAGLMHPNIVTVFDLCEEDATHAVFIVMELLRGRSLRHCMADPVRPLFSQVALPLCRALEAAHARGVLHRDIKPENVFVCEDGTIKLMDFGLARLLTANSRSQASLLAGTLAYMAPEQLKGGKNDGRADLYSLGILFYEYLSGVTPFDADNPGAILMKHLTETAPPLRNYVPDIAPELENVVLRLLEKEPSERFESATALREALERPMAERALPLVCAADRSLPGAKIYSAPTVPAVLTVEAPTPVMPVQKVVPSKPASFLQRYTTGPVKPAFLMGGVACFSVATLLFVGPIHRRIVASNSAEAGRIAKKESAPAATSGSLVQQANPVPAPAQGVARSNDQNRIETSQAHASAELDELIKQQEETRSEVERLEKLVASSETKRKAAESRASAAEAAFAGKTISGTRLTPQQKAQLNPLPPAMPNTLVQIAALHPHDQFEFRTKPITRTPDGTIQVQVHNSRACYVYFYLLKETRNQALLLPNGERRLSGTPQRDVFTTIGLRLDEPGAVPVKLLLLASVKPLNGLPAIFALPNVPKRLPVDVPIDRRFALLHDYRDQIVSTMQSNRVLLDGKNLQQDDLIVRFLRYKPTAMGAPPAGPPPLQKKLGQNGSNVTGTGTPQIASIPID
jgi:serine/threonine protein kinase